MSTVKRKRDTGTGNAAAAGHISPSMIARRNRILNETRRLIGEVGIANLSMDDVAKRAHVAKRTLYNSFQSKEHLLALAINKYYYERESGIHYTTRESTIERLAERISIVARDNLEGRNYARALVSFYFSANLDPEIRHAVHQIARNSHEPWVLDLAQTGQLQPWIDPETLVTTLVRLRYATIQAWAEELIPNHKLVITLLCSFFTMMAGATKGKAHDEIMDFLSGLEEHPLVKEY